MTHQPKDKLTYWIGFSKVNGIGPARLKALLDYFGDIATAWQAQPRDLEAAGLDRRSLNNLVTARDKVDLGAEWAQLERLGVRCITWDDETYPARLRRLADAPPILYVRGELIEADTLAVGVVGTRKATAYGKQATREIVGGLASRGVTIISGLALGIDAEAHQAALDVGGRTIAVLGSGPDTIYPPQHRPLAERIVRAGALVTEYPLGTMPEGSNFPPRNRIISGLAQAVLVVEASQRSGALITADFAREQGRTVFAVPGNIFHLNSQGTNRLIQEGAKLATSALDILDELELSRAQEARQSAAEELTAVLPEDPLERRLYECLSKEPRHLDEVSRRTGLPVAVVSSALSLMELKGLVLDVGGMNYVIAKE